MFYVFTLLAFVFFPKFPQISPFVLSPCVSVCTSTCSQPLFIILARTLFNCCFCCLPFCILESACCYQSLLFVTSICQIITHISPLYSKWPNKCSLLHEKTKKHNWKKKKPIKIIIMGQFWGAFWARASSIWIIFRWINKGFVQHF